MIRVICKLCKKELDGQGGIILTPPFGGRVGKYHICKKCFRKTIMKLFSK